jgi:hypothetical protein
MEFKIMPGWAAPFEEWRNGQPGNSGKDEETEDGASEQ